MESSPELSSKVDFFNVRTDVLSRQAFFAALRKCLAEGQRVTVSFLNAHCFNVAQRNEPYRQALLDSTFLLNDGIGVEVAGRLIDVHFTENMNGTDLIPELIAFFEQERLSVFFYGARPGVIDRAVERLRECHPELSVAGSSDGFVEDTEALVERISQSLADVVVVGLGVPKQELWVAAQAPKLKSVRVFVCGGAIFDFISGEIARAPRFLRRIRLEWLFRLGQEPRRLLKRYVIGNFLFFYYVVTQLR